jgi:hypothetical protein
MVDCTRAVLSLPRIRQTLPSRDPCKAKEVQAASVHHELLARGLAGLEKAVIATLKTRSRVSPSQERS